MKEKVKVFEIIESLYFAFIMAASFWHYALQIRFYPRWLHLTPFWFGIGGFSLIILIHSFVKCRKDGKSDILKNIIKTPKFYLFLAIAAEIHFVLILEMIRGLCGFYRVMDFAVFDIILITTVFMCYSLEEKQILTSMRFLSLLFLGFAIYGIVTQISGGFSGHMYAGMENPQTTGVFFLIAFWLPAISDKKWVVLFSKAIFALSIILTWERSCWLGLFISICVYLVLYGKELWKQYSIYLLFPPLILVAMILLIPYTRKYLLVRLDLVAMIYTLKARITPWEEFLNYFIKEAGTLERLIGNGYDTIDSFLGSREIYYYYGARIFAMDNTFLSIIYEFGIVGLILFASWVIHGLKGVRSKYRAVSVSAIIIVAMVGPAAMYDIFIRENIASVLVAITSVVLGYLMRECAEKKKTER